MKARAIAKLVGAGHQDLADQLLQSLEGVRSRARIEDGVVTPPMYRGFDDQSTKRAVAVKKLSGDDMVQVPGFGRMKVSQLKKQVVSKADDLAKRAKQGKFQTIGQANLDVFNSMWKVLYDLQRSGQID